MTNVDTAAEASTFAQFKRSLTREDWRSLSGMTGFIAWLGIAVCHYRFRRAYVLQGLDLAALPYRARWFPFGPLFAFALCLVITLGQNYQGFMAGQIDWTTMAATYIGIPLFALIMLAYRLKHRTRLIPLGEVDLSVHPENQPVKTVQRPDDDDDALGSAASVPVQAS